MKGWWHDNRHTLVTELAESGASDEVIMSIAGHVSRAMLSRYSHVRMEAKRRALDDIAARERSADEKRREEAAQQQPVIRFDPLSFSKLQSANAITPEVRHVDSRSHFGVAFPERRFRIGRLKYATTRPSDLLTGGIAEFEGTVFGGMYPVRDKSDYKLPPTGFWLGTTSELPSSGSGL